MPYPRKKLSHDFVPLGTQVVTRVNLKTPEGNLLHQAGVVAVIVEVPAHPAQPYRLRFADGTTSCLKRARFEPRKQIARSFLSSLLSPSQDLYNFVIYRCIVGSRAYGLETGESDTDRRGIYLPPANRQWSLLGVPEQLERHETQECYWELEKFLRLALRANPNVLECLYTPLVEHADPLAKELLGMRSIFLTRMVYHTYNGCVLSQFKKLSQDLRTKGRIRWKHAMHLIRLLLSGIAILKKKEVPIFVRQHREELLAIRNGRWNWKEVDAWRKQLHREFDAAFAETSLPGHPDYDRTNAFLIKARRSMV